MQNPPADLPDSIEELKAIIVRQADAFMVARQELSSARSELSAAKSGLQLKALEIEKLKLTIARLRKVAFGKSSEKIHREIAQLELSLEELESEASGDDDPIALDHPDASASITGETSLPEKRKRRALPDHLPREEVRHEPQGDCTQCGGTLKQVGEDITEILDYVPGHFKVIRHVRPSLSCRSCESMVQRPMPSLPVERGMPSAHLLAHVLVSKYADHLPLYRQSGIYARDGMELPRSLLANWVGKCSSLMQPLIDAIERHVLAGSYLHADDTPVPVLDPGRGKTRQGRLWIYLRDERPHGSDIPPAALYRYSPDRKGLHPQTVLKDFTGHLHADGYAGFNKLYGPGNQPVREVACWAHVRRKIHDVYEKTGSKLAKEALDHIGHLFDIERQIINKPPDDRLAVRQAHSLKQLDETKTCFEHSLRRIPGKSDLAGAFRYALTRWDALTCYAYDGRCEISNNAAERAIRPLAVGRRNWLFAGSDTGGDRAAAIYSLIETAKMQELDPRKYLAVALDRIADHPINRIDDLLPWNIDFQA